MFLKKSFVVMLLSFLFYSQQALSGILIEPYLGFRAIGDGERITTGTTIDYSYQGPVYGARVGYQTLGFMFGLDYSRSTFNLKSDTTMAGVTVKSENDYSGYQFGAFVGYNLPILLRAWAGYYFDSKYEDKDGSNTGDNYTGKGMALGVGFTGLPFVSLNLEIRRMTFDEFEDASLLTNRTTTLNGDNRLRSNEIILSVSVPFDI